MPDCYTHVYLATQALMRSGQTVACHPAFMAGANGPDVLSMYRPGSRHHQPDLPGLAVRMHHEDTGAFLGALISLAVTPVQQSYTLGFVCHYIADCTLHPYVAAMSAPGQPYAGKNGFLRMEASIDSTLYHRDYKTPAVPLHAGTPVIITEELAQVTVLLQQAIHLVYGLSVPQVVLADTYHDNTTVREMLTSRSSVQHLRAKMMETHNSAMGGGFLTSRIQPAPLLEKLPRSWVNPYSGLPSEFTLDEMLAAAAHNSAICVGGVMQYWLGMVQEQEVAALLGSSDYYTGLPCHPAEAASPWPDPADLAAEAGLAEEPGMPAGALPQPGGADALLGLGEAAQVWAAEAEAEAMAPGYAPPAYAPPQEALGAEGAAYADARYAEAAYAEAQYTDGPYADARVAEAAYAEPDYAGDALPYGTQAHDALTDESLLYAAPADGALPDGALPDGPPAYDTSLPYEAPAGGALPYAIPADGTLPYEPEGYGPQLIGQPLEPALQSLFEEELPQPYLAPAPAEAEDYYAADPAAAAWPLPLPPLPDGGAAPAGIPQEYLYSDLSDFGLTQAEAPAAVAPAAEALASEMYAVPPAPVGFAAGEPPAPPAQPAPEDPALPDADLVLEAILREVLGSNRGEQRKPPAAS